MKVTNMMVSKVILLLISIFSMLPLPLDAFCETQSLPVGQVQEFVVKDSEGNECDDPEILLTFATSDEPVPESCEEGVNVRTIFTMGEEFYVGMCVRNNCPGTITVRALFQYSGKRRHGSDRRKEKIAGKGIIPIYVNNVLTKKGIYTYKITMSKGGKRVAKKTIKLVVKGDSEQSETPTASPTASPTRTVTATPTPVPTVSPIVTPLTTSKP